LILYWPGIVPEGRVVDGPVDLADLAPTYAALLGVGNLDAEGEPLPGMITPRRPPALIVTVVLDGGGWNVLEQYPSAWPHISRLSREGISYSGARIGTAPARSGPVHATIGTGSYPRRHGIPSNPTFNVPNLKLPTISDLWDAQKDNTPLVAAIAYQPFHLGMLGHGAELAGGDHDIGVVWSNEDDSWHANPDYFTLPAYLQDADIARLEAYEDSLDGRDGKNDGKWFDNALEEIRRPYTRPGTPAFARFHSDAAFQILRNEGMGLDDVTDLMWLEFKMPDYAGHLWNMVNPEVKDVLEEVDAQVGRIRSELDDSVGAGNYLLTVTADHGQQPLADVVGGWRINIMELHRDIEARWGDIVEKVTTAGVILDHAAVREARVNAAEVARFLGAYTLEDSIPEGAPGTELVREERLDELLFAGAFPSSFIEGLTPREIESFGASAYRYGDLGLPPEALTVEAVKRPSDS
jgi:arylsulfatase A-like enzyme